MPKRRRTRSLQHDKSLHQTACWKRSTSERYWHHRSVDIGSTRSRCTFVSSRDTCFANAPYNRCQQQFLQHVSTSWTIIKDLNLRSCHTVSSIRWSFVHRFMDGYYVSLWHFVSPFQPDVNGFATVNYLTGVKLWITVVKILRSEISRKFFFNN